MHLWWPAISSGHHYHCHYQIQTYPSHYCCNSSRCCEKMPPWQQQEQHDQTTTEINLEFTWVQVFHAFGENSSIFLVKRWNSPAPGFVPLSGSWGSRRASASHAPNLAKRAQAVAATISWGNPLGFLFPIAMDIYGSMTIPQELKKS